jgi:hypothetical protein
MAEKVALRDKVPSNAAYAHALDALDVGFSGGPAPDQLFCEDKMEFQ